MHHTMQSDAQCHTHGGLKFQEPQKQFQKSWRLSALTESSPITQNSKYKYAHFYSLYGGYAFVSGCRVRGNIFAVAISFITNQIIEHLSLSI